MSQANTESAETPATMMITKVNDTEMVSVNWPHLAARASSPPALTARIADMTA